MFNTTSDHLIDSSERDGSKRERVMQPVLRVHQSHPTAQITALLRNVV